MSMFYYRLPTLGTEWSARSYAPNARTAVPSRVFAFSIAL
jgi:hypothetical protein